MSPTEIVIGTAQDLSGPIVNFSKAAVNGMRMRIDEANAAGGINGRKLRLVVEDHGYDPKKAVLAAQKLVQQDKIFVAENGDALEITKSGARFGGRISGAPVYVDGLGVGDVGNVVLRDRRHLSGDGMIVVTVTVDSEDGKVLAGPDIISRGFTYGGEGEGVLDEVRREATTIMEDGAKHGLTEWTTIRERVHKGLQKFIYDRTKRRPMIVPVVMEV